LVTVINPGHPVKAVSVMVPVQLTGSPVATGLAKEIVAQEKAEAGAVLVQKREKAAATGHSAEATEAGAGKATTVHHVKEEKTAE
jgi:hypothetical protein